MTAMDKGMMVAFDLDLPEPRRSSPFFRGLIIGLLLSLPIDALILWLAWVVFW